MHENIAKLEGQVEGWPEGVEGKGKAEHVLSEQRRALGKLERKRRPKQEEPKGMSQDVFDLLSRTKI